VNPAAKNLTLASLLATLTNLSFNADFLALSCQEIKLLSLNSASLFY